MAYERVILHSDLNAFYASVEMMLNPMLRGLPVAVCGSTENRHGIVLAKSELAKRHGIKTGMVNWEARKLCSNLVVVPPQYDQYLKYSKLTREIYYRYTDLVEPYGMDECWLDVTRNAKSGMHIAEEIRQAVKDELGLSVSIGVSYNKIFAKLGSDLKKPDAITEIRSDNFREKIWHLAADEMVYCGPKTMRKLQNYGIHTIGDVAQTDPKFLSDLLGVNGVSLWRYANGTDTSRVMHKDFVSTVQSVGHGITCNADLLNDEEVWKVILALSQDIGHRLRVHGLAATGVQLAIRGNDLHGQQFQCKLPFSTQLPCEIASTANRLFREHYRWDTYVRAVSVRAINLIPATAPEQASLFIDIGRIERRERLEDTIEALRGRFGNHIITYGSLLGDLKMTDDGRHSVKMPGMMYV